MDFRDIDIANMRVNEARKMGLESQRAHRAMHADKNTTHESWKINLRSKVMAVRCFILQFAEKFYCRILGVFYSRLA